MAGQDVTVGKAMETLANLYYELDQPDLDPKARQSARQDFEGGIAWLYPLTRDQQYGGEVSQFLSTVLHSDAQRRLERGELTQEESDAVFEIQEKHKNRGIPRTYFNQSSLTGEEVNNPKNALSAYYGTRDTFSSEPYGTKVRGPRSTTGKVLESVKDFFDRGDEDFAVSEGLLGYTLSEEQRSDLEYRAALASGPIVTQEVNGIPREGVETPRGFVGLPILTDVQRNMAYFAKRGGLTGGTAEPIQWAFHKIANLPLPGGLPGATGGPTLRSAAERVGIDRGWDVDVVDALGRKWPMVPVLTGNKEEDHRLLTEDPRWARVLADAHPDAWVGAVTETAGATYFLSSMVPVVGAGKAGLRGAKMAAGAVRGSQTASAGTVAGRYAQALKDVYATDTALAELPRLPFVTGTGKAVAEMAWYEGVSAAITGSQDPLDAAIHGGKLGALAFTSGSLARSTWNLGALGVKGVTMISPKAAAAMEKRMAKVAASAETEFASKAMREQVKRVYEGGAVGLSLGSIAETERQNDGKPFNPIEDLNAYLANLGSETALHSGLAFAFATGLMGGVQYRDAKGVVSARIKERLDDWAETAKEAAKDMPPEAVEELAKNREAVSQASDVRLAREALGRQEFTEGDPLPVQYGLMDIVQWYGKDPKKAKAAFDNASQETLRRVIVEARNLPDAELKAYGAPYRKYAQELLAKRLEKPVLEQEAAQKRQEMQLDPFRGGGIPDVEGLKGLGFKAERHALNAVNKYLGKEYESLKDVPEREFWEAVNLRNIAKAKDAEAPPEEATRALETTTEKIVEAPTEATPEAFIAPPEPPKAPARGAEAATELPFRAAREDYRDAQSNFDKAFSGLSRVRQRTEQGWRDLTDPDLPMDSERNASLMRRLHDGDPTLRDLYRQSVDPFGRPSFRGIREADFAFKQDQAYVRNAVGWTVETMRTLARQEGREAETVDLYNAIQHRSRGEPLPEELVKRLDKRGLIDRSTGKPYLTEGAESLLSVEFLSRFNDRIEGEVEGNLPMFATPNPLSILQMGGILSEKMVPGKDPIFRRALNKISLRGVMDALDARWKKGDPSLAARGVDEVLAFVKRNLIKPLWTDALAIPETTPATASRTGRGVRAARRILQSEEFRASNLANRINSVMEQWAASGINEAQSRLMMRGLEAGWHTRAKDAKEFHQIIRRAEPGISEADSANMLRMMRRYNDVANDVLDYGVEAGLFSRKQADAWRSRYVPHVRPMSSKDLIAHVMKGEAGVPAASGREMERVFEPEVTEGLREVMDIRHSSPKVIPREAMNARLMSSVGKILQSEALRESEYQSLPRSIREDYEPMAVRQKNLPQREGESDTAYNQRIARTRPRQLQWGDWLDRIEATSGRGTGKAPLTPGKRKLLAGMEKRYIDSNTAKELELLFNYMDPGTRGSWWLAEVNQFWRRGKTARNPSHLIFNVNSSVMNNWLMGMVGPEQFVRMLMGGGGPYADAFKAVADYYDWAFAKHGFAENAPMDWKALEGHPSEQSIRMFHSFLESGGMTTHAHLFLDTVTARDLLEGLTNGPKELPEFRSERDKYEWGLAESANRTAPATRKLDVALLKMAGSPAPEQQAQAIRIFDSYYQVVEQAFKFAPVLAVLRRTPGMTLQETTERTLEGTADYGARNPHLYQWMSLMQMSMTDSQRRAREALKVARKAGSKKPRPVSLEEGRIYLETFTPEYVKALGKVATSRPFIVYPHVMIPAMFRKSTSSPMNMARAAVVYATYHAISSAFQDDDLELAMAGGAEFPDSEAAWAVPSVEAIDELERTGYFKRIPPWLYQFGSDATNQGQREWLKNPNKYAKMWKEILLESRKRAIARAPSRGQEERYFDNSEFGRPVTTVAEAVHGVQQARAPRSPFWHPIPFFEEQAGYMGSAVVGLIRDSAMTLVTGRKGKERKEVAFEFANTLGNQMPQIFPGILGFAHPKMRRFAEEALLDGQRFQDVLAGIEDPTINRQSGGERMLGAFADLLGRTRKVSDAERVLVDQGGVLEKLYRATLGGPMPRGESKDPLRHTYDILERRLDEQVEKIVVDGVIGLNRGDFINLDSWYAAQFGYEAYRKEDGTLDPENGGMLAQWALRQEAMGYDPADVDVVVGRMLNDVIHNDARDEIITLARRRDTPPSIVSRLWRGMNRDNRDGLLDEIHRMLIDEGRSDVNEPLWHIYDRVFHDYNPTEPVRAKKIKAIDDYYAPMLKDMPEGYAQPVKTLGPKGIDLAPVEAINELPPAETPQRFKALESLLQRQ